MATRTATSAKENANRVREALTDTLIGQPDVYKHVAPAFTRFFSYLNRERRPVGSWLLAGPTGVGKTHTVSALAKHLHGHDRHFLRIDGAEYSAPHEVAKLLGAPPGYLGHRETQPLISQAKLNSFTSETCGISLVLIDEVEKADERLRDLFLGVLDNAELNLGDNTKVNFERSAIFFTTNLGAAQLQKILSPALGFNGPIEKPTQGTA